MTPISAVTAPDPYPFYEQLVAERPFYFDDDLGMWIASSAQAVEEVLSQPAMRVRPPSEPVPKAIAGTVAGDIFSRFARMTDGPQHERARANTCSRVEMFDLEKLRATAQTVAASFGPLSLNAFMFTFPTTVLATAMGITDSHVAEWTGQFVRAVAAGSTADEIVIGCAAAERLSNVCDEIGLLFQTYDATAALIGNTLLAFADGRAGQQSISQTVAAVVRYDPPVHNTRRFAAAATNIHGATVNAGDCVLAVLAAANRDPQADGRVYTFGTGPHACPGSRIACTIAEAGVEYLLPRIQLERCTATGYRTYPNIRMPDFSATAALR